MKILFFAKHPDKRVKFSFTCGRCHRVSTAGPFMIITRFIMTQCYSCGNLAPTEIKVDDFESVAALTNSVEV